MGGMTNTFRYEAIGTSGHVSHIQLWRRRFLTVHREASTGRCDQLEHARREILDRWRQPGDDCHLPRALTLDETTYSLPSGFPWWNTSLFIFDASYLRLRNLTLGYNVPSIGKDSGLQNCRINVNAHQPLHHHQLPRIGSRGCSRLRKRPGPQHESERHLPDAASRAGLHPFHFHQLLIGNHEHQITSLLFAGLAAGPDRHATTCSNLNPGMSSSLKTPFKPRKTSSACWSATTMSWPTFTGEGSRLSMNCADPILERQTTAWISLLFTTARLRSSQASMAAFTRISTTRFTGRMWSSRISTS